MRLPRAALRGNGGVKARFANFREPSPGCKSHHPSISLGFHQRRARLYGSQRLTAQGRGKASARFDEHQAGILKHISIQEPKQDRETWPKLDCGRPKCEKLATSREIRVAQGKEFTRTRGSKAMQDEAAGRGCCLFKRAAKVQPPPAQLRPCLRALSKKGAGGTCDDRILTTDAGEQ